MTRAQLTIELLRLRAVIAASRAARLMPTVALPYDKLVALMAVEDLCHQCFSLGHSPTTQESPQ